MKYYTYKEMLTTDDTEGLWFAVKSFGTLCLGNYDEAKKIGWSLEADVDKGQIYYFNIKTLTKAEEYSIMNIWDYLRRLGSLPIIRSHWTWLGLSALIIGLYLVAVIM